MRFTVILCLAGVVDIRTTMMGAKDWAHGEHHLPADYESIASCRGSLPLHSLATLATWQGVQIVFILSSWNGTSPVPTILTKATVVPPAIGQTRARQGLGQQGEGALNLRSSGKQVGTGLATNEDDYVLEPVGLWPFSVLTSRYLNTPHYSYFTITWTLTSLSYRTNLYHTCPAIYRSSQDREWPARIRSLS